MSQGESSEERTIEFELRPEELGPGARAAVQRQPWYRRHILIWVWLAFHAVMVAIAPQAHMELGHWRDPVILLVVTFIAGPHVLAWYSGWNTVHLAAQPQNAGWIGRQRVSIGASDVTSRDANSITSFPWSAVSIVSNRHGLIFLSGVTYINIPRRVFRNESAFESFVERAREAKREAPRVGPIQMPGSPNTIDVGLRRRDILFAMELKHRLSNEITVLLLMLPPLSVLSVWLLSVGRDNDDLMLVTLIALASGPAVLAVVYVYRAFQFWQESMVWGAQLLGPSRILADISGVRFDVEGKQQTSMAWQAVNSLIANDRLCLLETTTFSGFVIPAHAFPDQSGFQHFVQDITSWRNASLPAPASAVSE